jgi:hypothetical protein
LICDSDTSDTWQIDESQVRTSVRIDLQDNWFINDVFIVAAKFVGEPVNVVPYFRKIGEFFAWNLLWENTVGLYVLGNVIETELERSSRDDTITTG